ncbi:HAMP domain-containing histidine kinase [Verrucomicrobiales bacterium]|nr:HAMP domain-containing histidine kinase [Verrucomicrobiales bacterium]
MAVLELTEIRKDAGFTFPEKLVDQSSPTAQHHNALLRGLTHKLNNLLAVIQGFSSLVLMQDGLDEMSQENLKHMKDAAGSASDLGEQILPAGGCSRVDLAELKLAEFVPMLINRLRSQAEKSSIPFESNVGQDLPVILTDQGKLRMILDRLVTNAVEAVGTRGDIAVDVLAPGQVPGSKSDCVDVFVRNTGSEIPEEKLLEIFQPFYTTKDSTHLGIGLSTAYVLAGQLDMDLGVRSVEGTTTFWLRLKVAS